MAFQQTNKKKYQKILKNSFGKRIHVERATRFETDLNTGEKTDKNVAIITFFF